MSSFGKFYFLWMEFLGINWEKTGDEMLTKSNESQEKLRSLACWLGKNCEFLVLNKKNESQSEYTFS